MTPTELSVVLVAWNSADSLTESLDALRVSAAAAEVGVELVVVDNGSGDASADLADALADIVVRNPINAGYVVAASQGIARSRGAWVMLANPDLVVDDGFVPAMIAAARAAAPDVAALVPDIRYAADRTVVNSRGITVDALGIPSEYQAGQVVGAEPDGDAREVFGVSSSGCVLRRSALEAVGGLEPLYFAYLEDVDLSWRLRKRGFRAVVVPDAVALHEGSASTGEGSWLKAFLVARNRRALFRLHGPHDLPTRPLRSVTEVGHATVQALSGSGTASVRGRLAALGTRRYTRFLRASNRAIGLRDVPVTLAPREPLGDALRRKRAAEALMRREQPQPELRQHPGRPSTDLPSLRERTRVLVDATNLKPGQGGIRTYTLGLVEALAERPEVALVVATSVPDFDGLPGVDLIRTHPKTQTIAARALWRERHLASLADAVAADVVLAPVPELPLRRLGVPTVVVVHDVGPLVAPAFYGAAKRLRYRSALPRTCRAATAIVCVSQATLLDLHASTGVDPDRCVVIGEGPQSLGSHVDSPPETDPYVLYVGSLDERKNVATLVAAFTDATTPLSLKLVIVGPIDDAAALDRLSTTAASGGPVEHLGFVTPERLVDLYRGATAVALPSVYEGFGLPVLEALRHGAPVVVSDIPSVREIAGDAAVYVSRPFQPQAWRDAITALAGDAVLRDDLVRRGRVAADAFTWPGVAAEFAALLVRVAEREPADRAEHHAMEH